MEYISKLEGLPRNIFTGAIGYISNCRANSGANCDVNTTIRPTKRSDAQQSEAMPNNCIMDFNIAIRTILIKDGMLELWAGGGIVADSDPGKEYEECMLKAERILKIL